MQAIRKVKLKNFKRFESFSVSFNGGINTIVGDNESGKSTIIQAIDLVSSGSRYKIESIGLDSLLNKSAVSEFLSLLDKSISNLPEMHIELYLSEDLRPELSGKHNSEGKDLPGLSLICKPDEELGSEIKDALVKNADSFPYEFYSIKFVTFSGEAFTGYRRFLKTLVLDNTQVNNASANNEYIRSVFSASTDFLGKAKLDNHYRQSKEEFKKNHLVAVNENLGSEEYIFELRSGVKNNLESDLTLVKDGVPLEHRGKGQQCFVKTNFVLSRSQNKTAANVLLLEEPENHLSFSSMHKLISKIESVQQGQIILTTHSSLISSRLGLRNSLLISPKVESQPLNLDILSGDTAKFFMKAPNHNFLEFALSEKVILVEGDAEYMLLESFYKNTVGKSHKEVGVSIISVGGTSFKRYIEVAKNLGIKTAVVRDNDKNYQENCIERYKGFLCDNVKVFADTDNERYTLEVCVYNDNVESCNSITSSSKVLEYMLNNKSEAAFRLVDKFSEQLITPKYIRDAIQWVSE